ncbi:MAG: NAD-dependent epimerase/dehydratase family protein [Gemmataceae bacterium]
MRCVVTGSAGFIGSHVCEELLRRGHTVVGVDAFVPNYSPVLKAANQAALLAHPRFHFHALDLRSDPLDAAVADADLIFHLAARPGPAGWDEFDAGLGCDVQATRRLLSATAAAPRLKRFVFASGAEVYGESATGDETTAPRPVTPAGVTKLAAEHLCRAFAADRLPLVVLRYFGVYGPRQRPDMAVTKFVQALIAGEPLEIFGDGRQVRGWTAINDCVAATLAAAEAPAGETYNVGGDDPATVLELVGKLERIAGRSAEVVHRPARPGDPRHAVADAGKLRSHVGWVPGTRLDDGLAHQWEWQVGQAAGVLDEGVGLACVGN